MDVLFLAPGYPPEMAHYTRGLARVGARVYGVGDSPPDGLPSIAREALHDYLQVPRLLDEADVVERVRQWIGRKAIDRVESQWEPLVLTAARLREALGADGMSYDTVRGFRDKELMKERVRAAGLRVPHSRRVKDEREAWAAAEEIGYPLIVKPIAGAGSADTYRVNDRAEMEAVLARTRHVPEVSVEEFVEGEEFTYDTVSIEGVPAFENVAQYLPRPLDARSHEWISPIVITIRDLAQPHLRDGIALGRAVLGALGMRSGFTHMEWYRKANGEVVFGEIGCRPGGAHLVDQMNYTCDIDLFTQWANAVCGRKFTSSTERRFNCAVIFKRAVGEGRIRGIEGLGTFMERYGEHVVWSNLLPVGAQRRNWRHTLVSDGFLMVRHPDWERALTIARAAATDVTLFASS
jgi:biotin carboxylase